MRAGLGVLGLNLGGLRGTIVGVSISGMGALRAPVEVHMICKRSWVSHEQKRTFAGHSKWNNIRHRKAAQDGAKMKRISKMSMAITNAARHAASEDDARLKSLILESKRMGVPRDVIQKAVDKGLRNDKDTDQHMSLTYEGFGPEGVAVIVETITDNKNRTIAEVRHIFDKNGGNMSGKVSWIFKRMAKIEVPLQGSTGSLTSPTSSVSDMLEDDVLETSLNAGAEDVESDLDAGVCNVLCQIQNIKEVQGALEKASGLDLTAEFVTIPTTTVVVDGEENVARFQKFLDAMQDQDDVIGVHHNADLRH
ncbi:hypothetical protein AAMO2058_000844600 [Amorphochlora amoebiformis]